MTSGPHWGRVGPWGVGLELRRAGAPLSLEAYTFPSSHHIRELGRTIDALWGRAAEDRSKRSIVELLCHSSRGCDAVSINLAGCGVELAPFARLGRGTVYFHITNGQKAHAEQTLTLPVMQSL